MRTGMVSEAQIKMEFIEPVSQQLTIFSQDDMQREWNSYRLKHAFCAKTFSLVESSYGANFLGWSQNSGHKKKRDKATKVPTSSGQMVHAVSNHSYVSIYDCSIGQCDLDYGISKDDVSNNRNSRNKVNKKGRLHKKSSLSCSFDKATRHTPIHEISTNNTGFGDKNDMAFNVLLNENIVKKFDGWGINDDVLVSSLTSTTSISFRAELDESEMLSSLYQDFSKYFGYDQLGLDVSLIQNVCLSNFVGEVTERCLNRNNDGISAGVFCNRHSICSLDSFSDGGNIDSSTSAIDSQKFQAPPEVATGSRPSNRRIASEDVDSRESLNAELSIEGPRGMFCNLKYEMPRPNNGWSKVVSASESNTSETKCGKSGRNQAYCSTGNQPIKSGKRCGKERNFHQNSSGTYKLNGRVDTHGKIGKKGKENSHSVWRRVQNNGIDGCINELDRIKAAGPPLDASRGAPLHQKHDKPTHIRKKKQKKVTHPIVIDEMAVDTENLCKVPSVIDSLSILLKSKDENLRKKVSENLKRKPRSCPKQVHNRYLRKGAYTDKTDAIGPAVVNMQQNETRKQMIYKKPHCAPESPSYWESAPLSDHIDCSSSGPFGTSQEMASFCSLASGTHAAVAQTLIRSPSLTLDSPEETHGEQSKDSSEFQTDLLWEACPPLANKSYESMTFENNIFYAENSKQDPNSVTVMQKWVPIRKKETCMLDRSTSDNLLAFHVAEPPKNELHLKSNETEQAGFNSDLLSSNSGLAYWGNEQYLGNSSSPGEEEQKAEKLRFQTSCVQEKWNCMHDKLGCCKFNGWKTSKVGIDPPSTLKTYSDVISQIVDDAYKLQIQSEGIQLVTCSPLAEFERLLYATSPVVEQKYSIQNCRTCLGDQPLGNSLCSHWMSNVPLQSLWKWYEVPGVYGLEVKAEEHRISKKLGSNRDGFSAYFVPFLSSVQLFGHCKCFACSDNCWLNSAGNTSSENSSDLGPFPIVSMLLPLPHRKQAANSSQPMDFLSTCDPSVSFKQQKFCNKSVNSTCHDPELLFEYFESEQPYHRRTLFEKIQELIRGDCSSHNPVFGDPSTLNSLHLLDLHPLSWYSVAWYPIYRIPDGNFRAAFLTYHSLGFFIKRVSLDGVIGIVSPVVGLQSYNAQDECWFELRKSAVLQTELQIDHIEILHERLRTLERTASVMSRASVHKSNHKSINRHPDYEFFLSRRQ